MNHLSPTIVFETVMGLIARRGGSDLLGDGVDRAKDIYRKSLIGSEYPSFWLEAPLVGAPGFDLHVYYDRGQVLPGERFVEGCGFGMQPLFDWYFGVETGGVGVGFAHDLRGGGVATGTYVNFRKRPLANERGFFVALGAEGAHESASMLLGRMPREWSPWYLGLFPERVGAGVRTGAFVSKGRQAAYVDDVRELARDLERSGFRALDGEMLGRLHALSELPYGIELQLDAVGEGTDDVLGFDLTLGYRSAEHVREEFFGAGAGVRACALLEGWGVADGRWRRIADVSFTKLLPVPHEGGIALMLMSCVPAFIKAKWVNARLQPAKVYLQCETRLVSQA